MSEPQCRQHQRSQTLPCPLLAVFQTSKAKTGWGGKQRRGITAAHSFAAKHGADGNVYKDLRSAYKEKTQHLKQDVPFYCSATAIVTWGHFGSKQVFSRIRCYTNVKCSWNIETLCVSRRESIVMFQIGRRWRLCSSFKRLWKEIRGRKV